MYENIRKNDYLRLAENLSIKGVIKMKYTIVPTANGCVETIILHDGSTYRKRHIKTDIGSECLDDDFSDQMKKDGICEEILEQVSNAFDRFLATHFMNMDELDQ